VKLRQPNVATPAADHKPVVSGHTFPSPASGLFSLFPFGGAPTIRSISFDAIVMVDIFLPSSPPFLISIYSAPASVPYLAYPLPLRPCSLSRLNTSPCWAQMGVFVFLSHFSHSAPCDTENHRFCPSLCRGPIQWRGRPPQESESPFAPIF